MSSNKEKESETGETTNCKNGGKQHSLELSVELKEFYDSHNVEISNLVSTGSSSKQQQQSNADGNEIQCCSLPYRFIRLNPRHDKKETLQLLQKELEKTGQQQSATTPVAVTWLEESPLSSSSFNFYALPANFPLAGSSCFRGGRVYGMDISSGAGAATLLSSQYDKTGVINDSSSYPDQDSSTSNDPKEVRVLDLCCAPGLKLCTLADFFHQRRQEATIVGVDVSEQRMNLTKKIVQKYHIYPDTRGSDELSSSEAAAASSYCKIQLYHQDGTTFGTTREDSSSNNLVFDSRIAMEDAASRGKRKRMNKSARARERKRLKQLSTTDWVSNAPNGKGGDKDNNYSLAIKPFDFVLADAECSTDGSLKHMRERLKTESSGESTIETNTMLTDPKQLEELVGLQKRLLASGFRLLKAGGGGKLVYSTCSLSRDQNENVVQWLLDNNKDAFLIPVHFPKANKSKLVVEGKIPGTVRFYPNMGEDPVDLFGDGFFLAKIGKR